jgi:adenylate cyclase
MAEKELHTFLFADISGYSRISEEGGDEVAAELAIRFAEEAERVAREHGAEVVKRVGDAVMLRCECAAALVGLGLRLHEELGERTPIHVGIHTGRALERGGDWWGNTVNVASRVADAADAGQLLITEETKREAGDLGGTRLAGLGVIHLKNISAPVRVFSVSRAPAGARAVATSAAARTAQRRDRVPQLSLFDRDRVPLPALALEA